MAGYLLSAEARDDLDDIREFLQNVNPPASDRYRELFLNAFRRLARSPRIGRPRASLFRPHTRTWSVRPYIIVYDSGSTPIQIVRVLHGSRDIASILSD